MTKINEVRRGVDSLGNPPKKTKRKIGRRGKTMLAILIAAMFIGVASAALLPHFGKLTTTAEISQSVLVDGLSMPTSDGITETISGVACNLVLGDNHLLTNNADKKVVVDLVPTETGHPSGGYGGLTSAYPEYHLDARVDDDAFYVTLDSDIVWSDFNSASFDYLMDSDGGNLWIPQMNIVLRDGNGTGQYYACWHSFRTNIFADFDKIGERVSTAYLKGDFYIYELPSWALIGLYKDLTQAQQDLIDPLQFDYFTRQAGDTSEDPNGDEDKQMVWLSNFATEPVRTITGIGIPTPSQGIVLQNLWFRMLYEFACDAYEGIYTIETTVDYVGTV